MFLKEYKTLAKITHTGQETAPPNRDLCVIYKTNVGPIFSTHQVQFNSLVQNVCVEYANVNTPGVHR